jgi:hypothetical protein
MDDAIRSDSDVHPPIVPVVHEDESVPALVQRSQASFRRDLPSLLQTHYRQWVAYHGDERIGFAATETELYQRCFRAGLTDDEFVVRSIEPPLDDEQARSFTVP